MNDDQKYALAEIGGEPLEGSGFEGEPDDAMIALQSIRQRARGTAEVPAVVDDASIGSLHCFEFQVDLKRLR